MQTNKTNYWYIYKSGIKNITNNIRDVSGIKTTHESKMPVKVKKQVIHITIYRHSIPQSCLFIHLVNVPFETGLKVIGSQ